MYLDAAGQGKGIAYGVNGILNYSVAGPAIAAFNWGYTAGQTTANGDMNGFLYNLGSGGALAGTIGVGNFLAGPCPNGPRGGAPRTRPAAPLPARVRPPLAAVLDGHGPQQGFTGVYDAATGQILIRPSTSAATLPNGWVPRNGGHGLVSDALGGNPANHYGFAVILQPDGSLLVTWRSGTLNPGPNYVVPLGIRPVIVDAIGTATGRPVKVN